MAANAIGMSNQKITATASMSHLYPATACRMSGTLTGNPVLEMIPPGSIHGNHVKRNVKRAREGLCHHVVHRLASGEKPD